MPRRGRTIRRRWAQMMQERLHLTAESTVADIGAGTGKWTARLLPLGCRICAVEPNGSMRREAERLLGGEPRLTLLGGSAEHTGLPDASVDCVTAAQAFHWFDRERFRAECRRILTPGGPRRAHLQRAAHRYARHAGASTRSTARAAGYRAFRAVSPRGGRGLLPGRSGGDQRAERHDV